MRIKSLLPYYGSKRSMAAKIVEVLGDHQTYWEPFCGSMAVLFGKELCEMETVNDLYGDLINLARVVKDKELGFELYDRLARTLYVEDLFHEAKAKWISIPPAVDIEPDINRAYYYFVASWMGINGVSGTARYNYAFAMRWCVGGGQGAKRWQSVVGSMPAWHKRLRNVVIIRKDAFEVIPNIKDEAGVAIYCDPPYFDKSDKYAHDFTAEDHEKLAEQLKRFEKSKVVVSYYDCLQARELYKDFDLIECKKSYASLRNASRHNEKKRVRKEQVEVLIVNKAARQIGLFK